jgi:hypothetical protein
MNVHDICPAFSNYLLPLLHVEEIATTRSDPILFTALTVDLPPHSLKVEERVLLLPQALIVQDGPLASLFRVS